MYGYPSGYVHVSERAEPRRRRPVGIRPGRMREHSNGTNAAWSNPYGWERAERCEPNNRGERRIVLDRSYPNGLNPLGYDRSKISAVEIVRLGFDRVKILTRSNPSAVRLRSVPVPGPPVRERAPGR